MAYKAVGASAITALTAEVGAALVAGVGGALVDSLLGATVQALYRCEACDSFTESAVHPACGAQTRRVRGWGWVDNDVVNALATLSGAVIGALVTRRPSTAEHAMGGG